MKSFGKKNDEDIDGSVDQGSQKSGSDMIAKKDFEIHHNAFHLVIKVGDDLSNVPKIYLENLKAEGIL